MEHSMFYTESLTSKVTRVHIGKFERAVLVHSSDDAQAALDRLKTPMDPWEFTYDRCHTMELIERVLQSSNNERLQHIRTLLRFLKDKPHVYQTDPSFHKELDLLITNLLDSMMGDLSTNYLTSYQKCTEAIQLLQDESLKIILQKLNYPLFQEHLERIALYPEIMDCVDKIRGN